jgi:formylglycine-generating enzyme required for sulfatase activity
LTALIASFFGSDAVADDNAGQKDAGQEIVKNSIGMPFVRITIASDHESDATVIASLKRRLAPRSSYYLGVYEVRQSDFSQVLGRNPSVFADSGKLRDRTDGVATDRLPVDSVSWNDAVSFCNELSKLPLEQDAGRVYRLPTSDEWEYAARAGSGDMWCFGGDRRKLDEYAWFGFDRCGRRPHVVGGKSANAFGLYDMYGNVWEWCQDADSRETPNGSQIAEEPSRVICGGGWMSEPRRCNSVYSQSDPPTVGDPDTGFRVVMERGEP